MQQKIWLLKISKLQILQVVIWKNIIQLLKDLVRSFNYEFINLWFSALSFSALRTYLKAHNYELRTANYELRTKNYELRTTNYELELCMR